MLLRSDVLTAAEVSGHGCRLEGAYQIFCEKLTAADKKLFRLFE